MSITHLRKKKHRRERPMKNKIMKGSPKKTETDEIYPLFLTAPILSEQLSTKPISLLPIIKLKKSGNAYLFHSLLYFSCEVSCPGKELWPTRYVP